MSWFGGHSDVPLMNSHEFWCFAGDGRRLGSAVTVGWVYALTLSTVKVCCV